jgi:hypothetical protein
MKKELKRSSVMVPNSCKDDIEYIITRTGIKSQGELIKLLLARYRDDFVNAYIQFFNPKSVETLNTAIAINEVSVEPPVSQAINSAMEL